MDTSLESLINLIYTSWISQHKDLIRSCKVQRHSDFVLRDVENWNNTLLLLCAPSSCFYLRILYALSRKHTRTHRAGWYMHGNTHGAAKSMGRRTPQDTEDNDKKIGGLAQCLTLDYFIHRSRKSILVCACDVQCCQHGIRINGHNCRGEQGDWWFLSHTYHSSTCSSFDCHYQGRRRRQLQRPTVL